MALATRLRAAAEEGIVLGVKYGLALLLGLLAISFAFSDYTTVRQRALNGQIAFQYLQEQLAAQSAAPAPSSAFTPTAPEEQPDGQE